ncbi:MAG: hypothetical protein ACOCYG_00655, partial [Spirochaetota bacterium]
MTRFIALCAGALVLFSACASLDTRTETDSSTEEAGEPGAFVRMKPPAPEEPLEGTMSTAATTLPRPTAPRHGRDRTEAAAGNAAAGEEGRTAAPGAAAPGSAAA